MNVDANPQLTLMRQAPPRNKANKNTKRNRTKRNFKRNKKQKTNFVYGKEVVYEVRAPPSTTTRWQWRWKWKTWCCVWRNVCCQRIQSDWNCVWSAWEWARARHISCCLSSSDVKTQRCCKTLGEFHFDSIDKNSVHFTFSFFFRIFFNAFVKWKVVMAL